MIPQQIITKNGSATKSQFRVPWWDAARILLVACLAPSLILFARPTYAQDDGDPIVAQLVAADLVTPINHTATVNGVDVQINWVYADVTQVIVSLTMQNVDISATPSDAVPAKERLRVATPDGGEFSQRGAYADETTFTPDNLMNLTVVTQFYPQVLTPTPQGAEPFDMTGDYFAALGSDLPETIDLTILLDIDRNVGPDDWVFPMPGEPAEFTLPVTINLHSGITAAPQQSVTVGDLAVTLEQLTIAPSQTSLDVCWDLPDGGDWQPVPILHLNGVAASLSGMGLTQRPSLADVARCSRLSFAAFHDGGPVTVELEIPALRQSTPDTRKFWEAVADELAAQHGIVLNVIMSEGRYYEMVSFPDTMTEGEANDLLWQVAQTLLPRVDGPWIFTVDLQGAS